MTREIEFRAWHKKEKVMFTPEALWFNNTKRDSVWLNNSHEFGKYRNKLYGYANEDIILMQFTGKYDERNKRKVFEGDKYELGRVVYEVKIRDFAFVLIPTSHKTFNIYLGLVYIDCSDTKFLGNIFEEGEKEK